MSFGLRNAPSTFQRFITEVLRGLDFVFPYLDDVLIASSSEEEHEKHVKLVFDRFQQCGLRINLAKSVMGAGQVEYLRYLITFEGSRPLPEKVEVITNYKLPDTIHELRTFLGIVNFYRRYLKDAAKTQTPLHDLLKGAKKKDNRKVPWIENTVKNFEQCKSELSKAALLSFPKSGVLLSLCCDASDFAIGSVLQQLKPAYLLALDNQNEQNNFGQENDTSNLKEPHSLPDEEPTSSCGRKIKKPVRFRE
ncbi:retrovirus-related Pol polyprotein from transposon opus [Trichonephila clavata]|uniref:Retrovirus-related Pol polyprotein from transposon opus n=1 Tax=Trichonephila clavata TaxID=2740835 RepID=A0A8X6JM67_TRICU|nr:retrovirus-related Pol polyprotein from transposon opus [Trichonephila clavata]